MGLFGYIKNWIINKWNVSQNFDVYFKNFNKKLNSLTYVEETIDDEITRIYDRIKATSPQKYASQIQVYQRAMYEAKEHNKRVRIIEDGIIGFDYNQIVKDPRSFNYENIYTYDEIANLILKFSKRESKYDDFVQHVKLIKDYYNELVEEHDLTITYNQSSKIDKEVGYIDSVYKNEILSFRNSIRQKINSHQVTFNKLESDDVFINEIKKHNLDFIESNKRDTLFDDINKLSLDSGQRESILTDEVSTLVVAGAGSGKTLTICGKVKYLLERKDIKPTDILLLSYSRNSFSRSRRSLQPKNLPCPECFPDKSAKYPPLAFPKCLPKGCRSDRQKRGCCSSVPQKSSRCPCCPCGSRDLQSCICFPRSHTRRPRCRSRKGRAPSPNRNGTAPCAGTDGAR